MTNPYIELARLRIKFTESRERERLLADANSTYWQYILALESRLRPDLTADQIAAADAVIERIKRAMGDGDDR